MLEMRPPHLARVDQRWRNKKPRWVAPRQGFFDPSAFTVVDIEESQAREYVMTHHYSGSYPAAIHRFGVINAATGTLHGVLVYSAPTSTRALQMPFPDLEPFRESCELGRLVLDDDLAFNAETWAVGQAHKILRDRGVKGVLSFADPLPRHTKDGQVVAGHIGTVYQGMNAIAAGRGTARTLTFLPDGTVLNDRTRQKIRAQERGGAAAERKLVTMGAPERPEHMPPSQWLPIALKAVGATQVRHPGNYRYLMLTPKSRRDRERIRIGLDPTPYPKRT